MSKIATKLKVQSSLAIMNKGASLAGKKEDWSKFFETTVISDTSFFCEEMNRTVLRLYPLWSKYRVGYDTSAMPEMIIKRTNQWELAMKAVKSGIITINEARQEMQFNKKEGKEYDTLFVPSNNIPIESQVKKNENEAGGNQNV